MKELALYILDLSQNSIRAGAKNICIEINIDTSKDMLKVSIEDDGCGMKEELLKKVTDPFVTTRKERKVGLGIPLFKELVQQCEGNFEIFSEEGKGTKIMGTFKLSSVDLVPLGDIASTIVSVILSAPEVDIVYKYNKDNHEFLFDTKELKKILKGVNINDIKVLNWIKEYINENMKGDMEVE
ncbi:histidine kinase [Thermoanaerobacter mathranii subsp. mathranii str. A3]|uniref:histidine kinase n=1 Tax=Thermoanaerobacter mathranii subsp. mathranii (strain DSM 11426 / CCUG 53645 / CIP 108742 / A3) TaxID=583358 RepID=A0ABM5LPK8_THEM3|nr:MULTISPECIES: ATP-binding protein [Thermoanaerobacter]ADH60602.1 histidine kinase [Thermoanaerobacter mathranii subsp. mathranii str. A3]MBT1280382.1 ATP-binding protein [Thermoanaerobacter sp. CM-CNRG TB177]